MIRSLRLIEFERDLLRAKMYFGPNELHGRSVVKEFNAGHMLEYILLDEGF